MTARLGLRARWRSIVKLRGGRKLIARQGAAIVQGFQLGASLAGKDSIPASSTGSSGAFASVLSFGRGLAAPVFLRPDLAHVSFAPSSLSCVIAQLLSWRASWDEAADSVPVLTPRDYKILAKVAADPRARESAVFAAGCTCFAETPARAQSSFAVPSSVFGARL